jgi:hypothetical protein
MKNGNLLDLQRRTGEPSPSESIWQYPEGYGKASGSYTEKMRLSLWDWIQDKYGTNWISATLTFDYKLYRHKIVTVVIRSPKIEHKPSYGNGKRGFILIGHVLSIDGVQLRTFPSKEITFAWNRIIGRNNFLALPESK